MIASHPCEEHIIAERKSMRQRRRCVSRSLKKDINVNFTDDPSSRTGSVKNGLVTAGECPTYSGAF
jgi:hypothetical protein